jgi:hypothetical protein
MTVPYDPDHITYFAETDFRNQKTRFGIKSRDRTRHMYVIGKSGVGKSTLLENMAIQDVINGDGLAVLDPHGSFAEKILENIPENRIKDVIYFAPFDINHPISFNVLEDVGADRRHLVVSGLMSTFKKIWVDAWSARMEYILTNTLLALLEYPGATLLGVNRMLSEKGFRKKVVDNITDTAVKAFWTEEFANYTERMAAEAVPAIQNKIGQFTANPLVRNIIGQSKSTFDIRKVMDEQKILIINLSKGRIGDTNTSLLGSMIITKIYLAAMSRAEVSSNRLGGLPNFYFYVDEFQSFANETFAEILSEARKYKLALIIAHQYVAQMEEKVRDAVLGNVGTTISFRVGPLDAELLEKVFLPQFSQTDLINLGMAQIYITLMINDIGSQPFSARTLPPLPRSTINFRNDAIEWSRKTYANDKDVVEKNIADWFGKDADGNNISSEVEQKNYPKNGFNGGNNGPRKEYKKDFTPREDRPYTPKPRPEDTHNSPGDKHKDNASHKPFAKAFAVPVEKPEVSNSLKSLIDNIEKSPKNTPEVKAIENEPFTGEVPLRQSVSPVKHAERGPTEKNKDLLRAALQNINKDTPIKKNESKEEGTKPQAQTENKVAEQPKNDLHAPDNQGGQAGNKEVAHDTLLKILE